MFKRNQLYVSLFATSLMVASSAVIAQETVTSQASVTVQNAFDLTETTALSFGTVRASAVNADEASLTLSPDGSVATSDGSTTAAIAVLSAGQPGEYLIANASSFTAMTVSLPADNDVELVNASAPGTNASFLLSAFAFADVLTPGTEQADGDTVTTDLNGSASILIGATITTDITATTGTQFVDGNYVGNYTIGVDY